MDRNELTITIDNQQHTESNSHDDENERDCLLFESTDNNFNIFIEKELEGNDLNRNNLLMHSVESMTNEKKQIYKK